MLSQKENELLTRVGPGTPLGEMMRRYWHPIALSEQVSEPDSAPLRTKLLGERFVVFRDSAGQVGVLDEFCMHRGVSLALGRNEEGGLRCVYHGWKFAVDGRILETPNHADCRLRERMKAPAYPVREQSGLIWTYIGPKELQPPFRNFEYDTVPQNNRVAFRANTESSWLPLWEGGLDSSHVAILHTNAVRPSWTAKARGDSDVSPIAWDQLAPTYEIEDTSFGFQYCAFRDMPGEESKRNARLVPAIMPYMRIIPGKDRSTHVLEVPMDDLFTATYVISYSSQRSMERNEVKAWLGYDSLLYDPATCNFRLEWGNRLGQDRTIMKTSWSGYSGIELEDFAMSMSQVGWNRSKEHLVTSDQAVVRMRRIVLDALRKFQQGQSPPGVLVADMTHVISYDRDIEVTDQWQKFAPGNRVPAVTE